MFWLIEGENRFKEFCNRGFEEVFMDIIPLNHWQHPIENSICAFYIRPIRETKGYILPINHSECLNLFEDEVYLELKNFKKIYVRDKKDFLHYTILKPLIDITLTLPTYIPPKTQAHSFIYRQYDTRVDTNAIVPITKHYEVCEQVYDDLEHRVNQPVNNFYNNKATLVLNAIERSGIKIDKDAYKKHFQRTPSNEYVYTSYNFKTLTTRPSNKYDGINYAALPKENGCRESFIPRNDGFVEFDISAYHPTLSGMLVDYDFGDSDIHKAFASMYGVDYKKAKELTFKQLYGGVFKQYQDLPFFKKTSAYIQIIWNEFQEEGKLICPISNYVFEKDKLEDMNPQKLFNYVLQNYESSLNIEIMYKMFKLLRGKKTKLILYVFDSFLLDVDKDEEYLLKEVENLFVEEGLKLSRKVGSNYDNIK